MVNNACSDTSPVLHLYEINRISLLKMFSKIFISNLIKDELIRYKILDLPKQFEVKDVNNDQIILIAKKYDLDFGESSVIWLCKSLDIPLLLTDDLDARETAFELGIRPVGTVGIIMRGFREKIIDKNTTIGILKNLHKNSTLFITPELISFAIEEIKKFRK